MLLKMYKVADVDKRHFIFNHIKCFIPSIIATISGIIFPSFISLIIDKGIASRDMGLIIKQCMLMSLCGGLMIGGSYYQSILYAKFYQEFFCEIKNKTLKQMFKSNNIFLQKSRQGELYKIIIDDVNNVTSLSTTLFPKIISNVISLLGFSLYVLFFLSYWGIVFIALSWSIVIAQKYFGKLIQEKSFAARKKSGDEASFLQEVINKITEINMMGDRDRILEKYNNITSDVKMTSIKYVQVNTIAQNVRLGINTILLVAVLIVGSVLVFKGSIKIGVVFSLTIYIQRLNAPLNSIIQNYLQVKSSIPYLEKILDIFNNEQIILNGNVCLKGDIKDIEFKNLCFSYDNKENIYENFSLSIKKNDIIGIIGENGCGKSTLIKILMKQLPFKKGRIEINGAELKEIELQSLCEKISYVPQKTTLFNCTIKEMLNPANSSGITYEKMEEVLKQVKFDSELVNKGLDYMIGEGGNKISSGEAQKLAIAKMLLENKKVIIMDEPTAAMDLESEKVICEILKEYLKNRTAIIITHRNKILEICNKIVNLEKRSGGLGDE